jgi:hypothetical protein
MGTPPKWAKAARWQAQKLTRSIEPTSRQNESREWPSTMWKQ